MLSDHPRERRKSWFQKIVRAILGEEETGIKLCPIERSVLAQFDEKSEMRLEQIILGIRYAKQDDPEGTFMPIIEGLVAKRFLKKSRAGYYSKTRGQ